MTTNEPVVVTAETANDPPIQSESEPPLAATSLVRVPSDVRARLFLGASWLGFVGLVWLPVLLTLLGSALLLLACLASYALLCSGAFAATDESFETGVSLGLAMAAAVAVGSVLRLVLSPKEDRERVISPGGRILRVVRRSSTETQPGLVRWLPERATLVLVAALFVMAQAWLFRWPNAGPGTVGLVVGSLASLSLLVVTKILLPGGRAAWELYRFACRSEYCAGLLSGLFLVGSLGAGRVCWRNAHKIESALTVQAEQESSIGPRSFTASGRIRAALFHSSEVLWPQRATQEGARRIIAPLLARTAHVSAYELSWVSVDGLPRLVQYGGFVVVDKAVEPPFEVCVKTLFPSEVARVKELPTFRSFRLDSDTAHDVLLGAVLQVCENHAFRRAYDNVAQVLERAVLNGAIDVTRRRKRVVTGTQDEGYFDRCPSPFEAPDQRMAAEQELARVKWSELKDLQKAVILEKAVLELDDVEIAANHHMSPSRAKDTYQNAIKKIRSKLVSACR